MGLEKKIEKAIKEEGYIDWESGTVKNETELKMFLSNLETKYNTIIYYNVPNKEYYFFSQRKKGGAYGCRGK